MSEWANFRSTRSTSGWSTLGGQTANPYALDRNPSGSSSGSAAGLSAGFAPLAVGTETDGSIVSPSSACGVVGIKPTLGLVSRAGIVPLSLAQDTAGPMATSVADAAALLSVLAAADPDDSADDHPRLRSTTRHSSTGRRSRARGSASGGRPRRARTPPPRRCSTGRWAACASLGAMVIDPVDLPGHRQGHRARVRRAELRVQARDQRLPQVPGRVRGRLRAWSCPATLAELIEFNERHADRGARPVRPGDLPGGRGDQRRPGRPGLPGAARRRQPAGAVGGGDADGRAQARRDLLADRQPGLADRLHPRRPQRLRHLPARARCPAGRRSPSRSATSRASRSASRSSARTGASPACSPSPTPSSRRPIPRAPALSRQLPRTHSVSACAFASLTQSASACP